MGSGLPGDSQPASCQGDCSQKLAQLASTTKSPSRLSAVCAQVQPCLRDGFPYKKAYPDKAQDIIQRHRPQSWVLLPGTWMAKSLHLAHRRSRAVWDCLDPHGFPCGRAKVSYLKDTDCLKDIGKTQKARDPCRGRWRELIFISII